MNLGLDYYQETCELELGGREDTSSSAPRNEEDEQKNEPEDDDEENADDAPPNNLVSQSEFATFLWNFCATVLPGSACISNSSSSNPAASGTSTAVPSFGRLPVPVQLVFAPRVSTADEETATGCSTDTAILETLNCVLTVNNASSSGAGNEIYLKASQTMDILCSNDTYWVLVESDLLLPKAPKDEPNQDRPLAPSMAPALPASLLRPSNGNANNNNSHNRNDDNNNNISSSPGVMAAIVVTTLLIPMVLLGLYCYCWRRRKHDNHTDREPQSSKKPLQQLWTIFTATSLEDAAAAAATDSAGVPPPRRYSIGSPRNEEEGEEDPALVEDQSVISSEASNLFSPVSVMHQPPSVPAGSNGDVVSLSPRSWIFSFSPRSSNASDPRSFQQSKPSSNHKAHRRHAVATTRSNKSVQSHHTGKSSRASGRSRGSSVSSLDKKKRSTFAYPAELGHESIVSPGNSTWFQTTPTHSASSFANVTAQPKQISLDNPVHQRKRFNNNNKSNAITEVVPAGPTLTLANGSANSKEAADEIRPFSSTGKENLLVETNQKSTYDFSSIGANRSQEPTGKPSGISRYKWPT